MADERGPRGGLSYAERQARKRERYRESAAIREAAKARAARWARENPGARREIVRRWVLANPDKMSDLQRRQRAKSPEKIRARNALSRAVKAGRVIRGTCVVCDAPNAEAHHSDYSRPLEVIWLCRKHHTEEHRR